MTLTGPDASHHQGVVNWAAVKAAGHTYAFIKATEGIAYSFTSWFRQEWPQLRASGLVPGVYHFLRSESDPKAQARYFVDTVGKDQFAGALAVVDVETGGLNGTSKPNANQARAFAEEFHRLVPGHPLLVYTGRWYWRDTIGNPPGADIGPLWHSSYTIGPGAMYGGWSAPTFWQWTSSGTCPGIAGPCDLNRFEGDRAALLALTGAQPDPPPPPPEEEHPMYLIRGAERPEWWLTDFLTKRHITSREDANVMITLAAKAGHPIAQAGNNTPIVLGADQQDVIDRIDIVGGPVNVQALAEALAPLLPPGTSIDPVALTEALRTALGDVVPSIQLSVG